MKHRLQRTGHWRESVIEGRKSLESHIRALSSSDSRIPSLAMPTDLVIPTVVHPLGCDFLIEDRTLATEAATSLIADCLGCFTDSSRQGDLAGGD